MQKKWNHRGLNKKCSWKSGSTLWFYNRENYGPETLNLDSLTSSWSSSSQKTLFYWFLFICQEPWYCFIPIKCNPNNPAKMALGFPFYRKDHWGSLTWVNLPNIISQGRGRAAVYTDGKIFGASVGLFESSKQYWFYFIPCEFMASGSET